MKPKYFTYLILLIFTLLSFTNYSKYEIIEDNILFKIERSRDADAIFYNLNVDKRGVLDSNNPISPLWKRSTQQGQAEPLTWIQKKYAYGVRQLNSDNGNSKFCFVSYPKREFALKKTDFGYKVYTISNSEEVEVNRIFIQFDGGTFWIPIIKKVELHGINISNGIATVEVIRP